MSNSLLRRPAARSNRWDALAGPGDYKDDRLSELPDDVLLTIVERLDIADTARTSILARRWRHIPAMLSKIVIKVGSFEGNNHRRLNLHRDDALRANTTMVEATRSILESRSANKFTINLLHMQFYLGDESIFIGQTVANTMATQKVGLAEFTILTKKEGEMCTHDDLVTYGRQLRSFVDACPNTFGGLARLRLENVRLGESDLAKNFSICKRLEFLRLHNCDMGILYVLEVEHPQLSELQIVDSDFERVDLKWLPKLTLLKFTGWISQHDPLSFGYVTLLQRVRISNVGLSWHKMLKLSEFLGKATIGDLHANFRHEKIWVIPEGPKQLSWVFRKLKTVDLVNISEDYDLAWTMFILQGAPFLEELCIRVRDHFCKTVTDVGRRKMLAFSEEKKDKGLEQDTSVSDFKHHNLVVLRIFGFQVEDKFMSYIRSVLEAAVDLENIYLYNRPVCNLCQHMVREPSRYPCSLKQRISLRNKIHKMCSRVKIHFPNLRTC